MDEKLNWNFKFVFFLLSADMTFVFSVYRTVLCVMLHKAEYWAGVTYHEAQYSTYHMQITGLD